MVGTWVANSGPGHDWAENVSRWSCYGESDGVKDNVARAASSGMNNSVENMDGETSEGTCVARWETIGKSVKVATTS